LRLAAEGAPVAAIDLQEANGEETVSIIAQKGGRATFFQADVRLETQCLAAIEQTVDRFGRLDVLVNNAWIYPQATLDQTTEAFWDQMIAVNLKGPFFLCNHSVPVMRRQGGGSITNTGSMHGLEAAGNLFAYSVSKGGLLTPTKNLAVALVNDKVRVNYLIPGWVLSPTELRIRAEEGRDEKWIEENGRRLGMGRYQLRKMRPTCSPFWLQTNP
jgi:NAD(P)-dependent dehydrogenase (short-subunit alcohol dehydrogenase family)